MQATARAEVVLGKAALLDRTLTTSEVKTC
jgi:hypothetical protein